MTSASGRHQQPADPAQRARRPRLLRAGRIEAKRWYLPVLLLMPAVSGVVYGLMRWAGVAAAVSLRWRPGTLARPVAAAPGDP